MRVMRQRADAEIGRKQHQRQHGRGDRAHPPREGAEGALPLRRRVLERHGNRHGMLNADGLAKAARVKQRRAQGRPCSGARSSLRRDASCQRNRAESRSLRAQPAPGLRMRSTRSWLLALHHPGTPSVLQHEARAACLADAVAEVVGLGPRVGADAHLVERRGAAAAHTRSQARGPDRRSRR